jgi:hypothetical protein
VATGSVTVLDGGILVASGVLNATGDASVSLNGLGVGTHTLTAVYAGDADFLGSSSAKVTEVVEPVASPDFSIAPSGASSQTAVAGTAVSFSFEVTPIASQGVSLASPVVLSVSGLPVGATGSFSPAFVPPGGGAATVVLTIQTPKAQVEGGWPVLLVLVLPVGFLVRRRRWVVWLAAVTVVFGSGCGARVNVAGQTSAAISATYNIVVTGTATGVNGAVLVHSVTVTLVVE